MTNLAPSKNSAEVWPNSIGSVIMQWLTISAVLLTLSAATLSAFLTPQELFINGSILAFSGGAILTVFLRPRDWWGAKP